MQGTAACHFHEADYNFCVKAALGAPLMSQVFLAYRSVDAARANTVRAKLEALDVPLFIDHKLVSGDDYIRVINEQLDTAVAVLVLWTAAAVDMSAPAGTPNFVLSEAERGFYRGILVAAAFDRLALSRLPVPFNRFQTPDVSDWIETGASAGHQGWQSVLKALGNKLGRPGLADLAIALESADDVVKKKFLNEYSGDPGAKRVVAGIEAFERSEFESRFSTARKRVQQRAKEAERKLRACRDEFEAQLVELHAGRNFMPPDPVKAVDDNAAKLSNQIDIHETTIEELRARAEQGEASTAKATAEIAVFGKEIEQLQQQVKASESLLAEQRARSELAEAEAARLAAEAKLKSHPKDRHRRVVVWSGLAALAAAILFGWAGRWSSTAQFDDLAKENASLAAKNRDLSSKVQGLTTDAQKWHASYDALQRQDAQKISELQATLDKLATQIKDADAKNRDLTEKNRNLTADNQKYTELHRLDMQRISDLQSSVNNLTAQLSGAQEDMKAKKAELARDQAALASVPVTAQCDLLAGYQYDPDRPQSSGWADSVGNVPEAQAICDSARQGAGKDPRAERRMLLALGRIYMAGRAPDTALQFWTRATAMGSSHAAYELGKYYVRSDPTKAWGFYTQAANMVPPDPSALYWVALNNLYPDDKETSIIPPKQATSETGRKYLQKALNADFPWAYFIAGVYYWPKSSAERKSDDQKTDIENATKYLTIAYCTKHVPRPPDKTADDFYFQKTRKHLPCE
jgi:hypothetical protein